MLKDWQSIIAIFGSVGTAIFVNHKQYKNNKKIKNEEKQDFEMAVISSIYEELTGLYNCYNKEFEKAIFGVPDNDYMKTRFTITQDFFTIYHNNTSSIGKINNKEIRNSIVQTYILLKQFIENINFYNDTYKIFINRRREIMAMSLNSSNSFDGVFFMDYDILNAFTRFIAVNLDFEDYEKSIKIITEENQELFSYMLPIHRYSILNDNYSRNWLIIQTIDLKTSYTKISKKILELIENINKTYKIDSNTKIEIKTIDGTSEFNQNESFKEIKHVIV